MTMTTSTPSPALCLDCTINASTHTIRRRPLCPECLQRFLSGKVLKRMESFRPRNQRPKSVTAAKPRFLIPLSGGMSSLSLLAILTAQLRRQIAKTGRTGYELAVVHVDEHSASNEDGNKDSHQWWEKSKSEFSNCEFIPPITLHHVFRLDESLTTDLSLLGLDRTAEESNNTFAVRVFASARSATARSELRELLLKRLIVAIAKSHACEAILWGHSDTKLAATTLALVARGRGSAVSSELADGSYLWGLEFNYPLRDLSTPELEIYLECASEGVQGCLSRKEDNAEVPVSLKLTSIDSLLSTYITGQGEKYPSIVANVVKTAGKLQAPSLTEAERCRLCAGQITHAGQQEQLCYGCARMKQDIKT